MYSETNFVMGGKNAKLGCGILIITFAILAILLFGITIIQEGSVGVKKSFGKVNEVLLPGFYIIVPFKDSVTSFDIRTRKIEGSETAASKDLQAIEAGIAVNYRIEFEQVKNAYATLGDNKSVEDTIIKPAISESVKASTALFTAEENITKREELKKTVEQKLATRLEKFGIKLEAVSIQNLSFSDAFDNAIEQKQVAEQQAKQAEYEKQKASVQAETKIIEAKGEAERQRLLVETLSSELLQKQWIEKWDGKLPTYTGGDNGNVLFQMPTSK